MHIQSEHKKANIEKFVCHGRSLSTDTKKTFVNRPSNSFQKGDYEKSTAEDIVWVAEKKGFILGFVSIYVEDNFIHNLFVQIIKNRG